MCIVKCFAFALSISIFSLRNCYGINLGEKNIFFTVAKSIDILSGVCYLFSIMAVLFVQIRFCFACDFVAYRLFLYRGETFGGFFVWKLIGHLRSGVFFCWEICDEGLDECY